MSFAPLETYTKRNAPPTAKITYLRGCRGEKPKPDAKPQLFISLPSTICGAAKAKTFALLIGSGEDAGKLRIRGCNSEDDGVAPTELKRAFVFRFGYVPKLGDEIFDGGRQPARKISDDEFEIDFPPEWFEAGDKDE